MYQKNSAILVEGHLKDATINIALAIIRQGR